MPTLDEVTQQALTLSPAARAELADRLVASLDQSDLGAIEQAWLQEARRRRDDVRSGRVKPIPAGQVMKEVRRTAPR